MKSKENLHRASDAPLELVQQRLLNQKIKAARRALMFERMWPRAWLAFSIVGLFLLVSALQGWKFLSPQAHAVALYGFGAAFALAVLRLIFVRIPSRNDALARLERASNVRHRPLTALHDQMSDKAKISPASEALWRAHQSRMASLLEKLKAGPVHPRIDKHDPWALRAALVLTVAVVCTWTWAELPGRVQAAFTVPEVPVSSDFRLDVWVTPPAYTRKEPIVLANGTIPKARSETVSVPTGSELTVKINGSDASRYAVSFGQASETATSVTPTQNSGENFAEYIQKVDKTGILTLKRSYGSATSWKIEALSDKPPVIAFNGPIEVSNRGAMLLKYKVEDDYGVVSAEANVERAMPPTKPDAGPVVQRLGKPPVFPLSLPRSPVKAGEGKTYKDLTAHPWAGLPVVISLSSKDETGAVGQSAPRGLILPERKFLKPLARAVIGQRRELVEAPNNASVVAQSLDALIVASQDDNVRPPIYLALRSLQMRLKKNPPFEDIEDIVDQLWDVAVKIEDGNLSEAERALRAAQDRLKEALERRAPQEEIQKLVAELREAMNKFLQALASQPNKARDKNASSDVKSVTPQDLQKLLNRIENLAKSGANSAAEQMLSQLRDVLESLQTAKQAGKGTEQSGEGETEEGENLKQIEQLTDLMKQQQNLLDQTFRMQQGLQDGADNAGKGGQRGSQQSNRGQNGQGPITSEELRQKQEQIRKGLQDLMSSMEGSQGEEIRQKLGEAERAMRDAGEALGAEELPQATEDEGRALDQLRQGTRAMAEQMMRSSPQGQGAQSNRDPLGRRPGGQINDPGDNVKVPEEITVQRAREILDELRKRLGQPSRPPAELDYLERLIKRF